jgi:polyhydroxyalkanoate synthase subunit PhaC
MVASEQRTGPRPTGLHLLVASLSWNASIAALPLLRAGSLSWSAPLQAEGARLASEIEDADPVRFNQAVARVAGERLARLDAAIEAYRRHPYRRRLDEPPTVWRSGTTRLLDYGALEDSARDGVPVLAIPSLVNRYYVLDLSAERSLARYLATRGIRLFMVDWDAPGPEERGFTLTDYITRRLEPALAQVLALAGRPVAVMGYCMGGLLATALALRRQGDVAALALLGTPWDFHGAMPARAQLAAALFHRLGPLFASQGELPVDVIQMGFHALDPWRVVHKFLAFGGLDPGSPRAADFVALEDWVNDGVPLTLPVAEACLVDWYGANAPARGAWQVAGEPVRPALFARPSYVLVPAQDHIVPPDSALALAAALPKALCRQVKSGHIGMVVGHAAPSLVWAPLADWLAETGKTHAPRAACGQATPDL